MKVVIFGNGQTAQVIYSLFKANVVAFTVDKKYKTSDTFMDLPLIEFEKVQQFYSPKTHSMVLAIAYQKMNKTRQLKYDQCKQKGYRFLNCISDKAIISPDATIGESVTILENNNIQPFVKIGNNCILWSGNHIGHHTIIGDNCFIASHVVVSGSVQIGDNCFFGVNSTIRDNITIGDECIIGAGAVILHDVKSKEVYVGNKGILINKNSEFVKI